MRRDSRLFSKKASQSLGYEVGSYALESPAGACYADGAAAAPSFGEALTGMKHHEFPGPLNGVEFQPSETCPKNFVIFDQTYNKSRVMFHPSLAHNFGSSSFDIDGTHAHEAGKSMDRDNSYKGKYPSSYKEDTEDIDALLSSEEEEEDDDDDDVVSTGRTPGNWGGSSPDSLCSFSDGMKCSKFNSTNADSSKTKREKMKKMVRTLRGIIPGGGDQMDTPAVLDEAVKYLKSLKVDVKKLGAQNFDS